MQISLILDFVKKESKPLFSYLCVGGCAALVEWLFFALLANVAGINYLVATAVSFIFSTASNWILGRLWVFRKSDAYKGKTLIEGILIYAVSGIGLLFNLGLMYMFVSVLDMNSPIKKVVSKIISTGIVFFWNYCARSFFIYRSDQ